MTGHSLRGWAIAAPRNPEELGGHDRTKRLADSRLDGSAESDLADAPIPDPAVAAMR